jgi:hypothetical protein
MGVFEVIVLIFTYFIILTIFRLITIFVILKCIINIKTKAINNLNEKMKGAKK